MNYPHTTATDPYAFSFWPDAAASSEEEMMAWAQAAGYAQPGLTADDFSFGDLDAWGQSSTLPAPTYGPQNPPDIDWIFGGTVPAGDMFGYGASSLDATATDTRAFAQAPTPPFPTDDMGAFAQNLLFTPFDFSDLFSSTPSLTDESSVPSPQSDGTGDGLIPFPTFEGASSYLGQPSGPSTSQPDISATVEPDQFTFPPLWSLGDSDLAGQIPPGYAPTPDFTAMSGNMSFPTQLDYTRAHDHIVAPTEALATSVTVSSSTLGKRRRRSEENETGPQKRAKSNATRVLGGPESTKRARRSPTTRTQQEYNSKSKAAGHGAGRLASTTVQEVYRRFLPGLSVSQGSMGALEQGQPSWIEEREVETDTGSLPQQQVVLQSAENAEVGGSLHKIPGNLSARDRLMLETTQADEERGAVREIKCKLCNKPPFKSWEIYKRHCKSCEKHPQASKLKFCAKCGDYFGRPDSGVRHRKNKKYQKVCLETSQDEANEKKQKVERLLEEYEARLVHCLRNGEEIGPRFSDIVNKVLTNTSKKVSRR